jgi:hypothetical protein
MRERGARCFGVLDERLGHTHLPLVLCNARVFQDLLAARLAVARPRVVACIRSGWREEVEPLDHLLERVAVRKAGSPHSDVLLETEIFDLMQDRLRVVLAAAPVLVRLDSTDVGRSALHEIFHERARGLLEAKSGTSRYFISLNANLNPIACSRRALLARRVRAFGE